MDIFVYSRVGFYCLGVFFVSFQGHLSFVSAVMLAFFLCKKMNIYFCLNDM